MTWTASPLKSTAELPPLAPRGSHPAWLILTASAWTAAAGNIALWKSFGELSVLSDAQGWLFAGALGLMIVAAMSGLLSLFAWRWMLKPMLGAFLLAAAGGSYFMMSYHVVIDPAMMANAMQTDPREVRDLLGGKLFLTLLMLWAVPSLVVWRWKVDYGRWPRRAVDNIFQVAVAMLALMLLVMASFSPLASTMRNHKEVRYLINPLNSAYAMAYLAAKPLQRDASVIRPLGLDARVAATVATSRPPLLVLVLGETGRSANFGLNGYARNTTPGLARHGVSSFLNAWSCGTSTAASVPCMFSDMGREGYESRKFNSEGLLDVIQHAGMAVLWLDNQSGCKGVCDRVGNVSTANLTDPQLCPGGECYDGIMLKDIDARLAALPADRRAQGVVVVMHQMGSHGPAYHLRSPPAYKPFKPECESNDLQNCDRAGLVNAYDNSIAYTDHFLSSTIAWLKTRQSGYDPAMVYVADHGESLGENNLYLHGMPYLVAPDVQKRVPWITWISGAYALRTRVSPDCLRGQSQQKISHDHYFHSVLGLLAIQTQAYRAEFDAYAPCRASAASVGQAAAGIESDVKRAASS
ncbi:MAG: sulfatase [Polaromonas sp.]|nr:sulfatase [Polaromonas sp.]